MATKILNTQEIKSRLTGLTVGISESGRCPSYSTLKANMNSTDIDESVVRETETTTSLLSSITSNELIATDKLYKRAYITRIAEYENTLQPGGDTGVNLRIGRFTYNGKLTPFCNSTTNLNGSSNVSVTKISGTTYGVYLINYPANGTTERTVTATIGARDMIYADYIGFHARQPGRTCLQMGASPTFQDMDQAGPQFASYDSTEHLRLNPIPLVGGWGASELCGYYGERAYVININDWNAADDYDYIPFFARMAYSSSCQESMPYTRYEYQCCGQRNAYGPLMYAVGTYNAGNHSSTPDLNKISGYGSNSMSVDFVDEVEGYWYGSYGNMYICLIPKIWIGNMLQGGSGDFLLRFWLPCDYDAEPFHDECLAATERNFWIHILIAQYS